MKNISRIILAVGIAMFVSAAATLLVASGAADIAIWQAAIGIAALVFYFATNRGAASRTFAGKATLFYAMSLIIGVVLLGGLVAGNYIANKKAIRWDLTKGSIFTLSDDTVKTVQGLADEVKVTAFFGAAEPAYNEVKDLLDRYRSHSEKLVVEYVDPYSNPQLVKEKGIKEGSARVLFSRGASEQRASEITEESFTNAIVKLLRTSEKKVYFTMGHGEGDMKDGSECGYESVVKKLANEGLLTETLQLTTGEIPADAAAVLILGPRTAFFEPEIASIKTYLEKGGRLLVGIEPGYEDPALFALLAEYGFAFDNSLIVDPLSRLMGGGSAAIPVVQSYAEHDIVKGFEMVTIFPTARPLAESGTGEPKPTIVSLSNPTSWGETNAAAGEVQYDPGERKGALGIVAAVNKKVGENETRIVAIGDADFASNQYERAGGNSDFFLNTLNWLASQESRITIRPKQREASRLILTEADARFLNLFSMNGLPMLVLALGLSVWLVRKAK